MSRSFVIRVTSAELSTIMAGLAVYARCTRDFGPAAALAARANGVDAPLSTYSDVENLAERLSDMADAGGSQ